MRAFHFTSTYHLPLILEAGFLRRTESNLSIEQDHAGPPVVWLLDGPELSGATHGLHGASVDKTRIRFEVEVDDSSIEPWVEWVDGLGIDPWWRDILVDVGGGPGAAKRWLISQDEIPFPQWVSIIDAHSDRVLYERRKLA